jgi:hypothetical protein
MKIETKWNLAQRGYFINNEGTICTGVVSEVLLNIKMHSGELHVVENIIISGVPDTMNTKVGNSRMSADKLFPDKESAGIAWLQLNGLDCGLSTIER